MQQLSTNTLYKHKTGSRSFSQSCFSTKRQKTIVLARIHMRQPNSRVGRQSVTNEISRYIRSCLLSLRLSALLKYEKSGLRSTSASSLWISGDWRSCSRCAGSVMSPQNVIHTHTIWAALVSDTVKRTVWSRVFSTQSQVAFFPCFQAFIFATYFGNCRVCLGGCAWCACGRDSLGIPLRPVALGERRILSLRKATKLHLWSDRGMKCHKQPLRRQPAVTMAVGPVALRQHRHTFTLWVSLWNVALLRDCRRRNPKS